MYSILSLFSSCWGTRKPPSDNSKEINSSSKDERVSSSSSIKKNGLDLFNQLVASVDGPDGMYCDEASLLLDAFDQQKTPSEIYNDKSSNVLKIYCREYIYKGSYKYKPNFNPINVDRLENLDRLYHEWNIQKTNFRFNSDLNLFFSNSTASYDAAIELLNLVSNCKSGAISMKGFGFEDDRLFGTETREYEANYTPSLYSEVVKLNPGNSDKQRLRIFHKIQEEQGQITKTTNQEQCRNAYRDHFNAAYTYIKYTQLKDMQEDFSSLNGERKMCSRLVMLVTTNSVNGRYNMSVDEGTINTNCQSLVRLLLDKLANDTSYTFGYFEKSLYDPFLNFIGDVTEIFTENDDTKINDVTLSDLESVKRKYPEDKIIHQCIDKIATKIKASEGSQQSQIYENEES